MGLRKRDIDDAKYTGKDNARCMLWDDDPRGLGLRIFPSGQKTWVLSYRTAGGTKRLHTLGQYSDGKTGLTLEAARLEAHAELLRVKREQADPQAEKITRRIAATTGTVERMFRAYVTARRTDPRRPMKRHEELIELAELHIIPKLGARQWDEVRRSEVRAWHAGFAEHPYQGNRALQALRAAYYWRLKQDDDVPLKGADARNPCWGVELFPEEPRRTRLELSEIPALLKATDKATDDPYARAYFRFVLATGCRRGEALGLQWKDVDLKPKGSTATFRETKTAPSHTVPLSAEACSLLEELPRLKDNPHVFAGRVEGGHLVGIDKLWDRIRKLAGRPDLRIHDLRRSVGSWLGDAGFTSKQIGTVLGHKTDITSRVYMQLGDESARAAVDAVQTLMASGGKPARVAKLPKRARS